MNLQAKSEVEGVFPVPLAHVIQQVEEARLILHMAYFDSPRRLSSQQCVTTSRGLSGKRRHGRAGDTEAVPDPPACLLALPLPTQRRRPHV